MPLSKEQMKIYNKKYEEDNREKLQEYRRQYYQSARGKKSLKISSWKKVGLVCKDYDLLYSNYLAETHCDRCRCRFGVVGDGTGTFKCMDHSHITGEFRNFLCCKCNLIRGE